MVHRTSGITAPLNCESTSDRTIHQLPLTIRNGLGVLDNSRFGCTFWWFSWGLTIWIQTKNKLTFSLPNFTHNYVIKAINRSFHRFTSVIEHLGCWKNTRKVIIPLGCASWFANFPRVPPTSRVVYYFGKPIESVVYYLRWFLRKRNYRKINFF